VAAPCELLPWDTEFFGRRIGRVRGGRLSRESLARIERWVARERVECLYLLADPTDAETAPLAEAAGFRLVDVRVTLERRVPAGERRERSQPAADPKVRVRPAAPADLHELRRIAAASHHDSRFYYDPHFDRERCDELYATWIEKSLGDPDGAVLVAELAAGAAAGNENAGAAAGGGPSVPPCGYITVAIGPDGEGRIGLFAVAPAAQGRGAGGLLIGAALDWFAGRGADTVSVVTQGRNVRAQRIYQKFGMLTRSLELWYHRWWEHGATTARAGSGSGEESSGP
jgi:dTDP-4-amino-4,6-dideoxy-D-galactose acyltransferase